MNDEDVSGVAITVAAVLLWWRFDLRVAVAVWLIALVLTPRNYR